MIRFHQLELCNFGPYAKVIIPLDREGLIFIKGVVIGSTAFNSNGAGKTMLANAISWCLYERPAYRTPLKRGASEGYVRLTGNVDNRNKIKKLVICRGMHGKKAKTLEVFVGGKDVSEHTMALTQEKINELMGMAADTFLNTRVFRQGQLVRFPDMTDAQKKEILKEASHAQEIDLCREEVRRRISDLENQIREAELDLSELAGLISKLEGDIQTYEEKKKSYQDSVDDELEELQEIIRNAEKKLKGMEALDKKIKEVERLHQKLSDNRDDLADEIGKLSGNQETLQEQQAGLKKAKGSCPTCERSLPEKLKVKLKADLAIRIKENDAAITELKGKKRKLEERWRDIADQRSDLILSQNKRKTLQRDIQDARSKIQKKQKGENPFIKMLKKAQEELSAYTRRRARVGKGVAVVRREVEALQPWIEGFGNRGVIARILSMIIDRLDVRTNEYLSFMSGKELQVNIESSMQTKSKKVTDRIDIKTIVRGVEGFDPSGGQSKRIAIAMGMALADLVSEGSRPVNILVLDEVSSGLDEIGKLALFSLLERIADKEQETILVIDHDPEIADNFDKVITVEMENGESTASIGWS